MPGKESSPVRATRAWLGWTRGLRPRAPGDLRTPRRGVKRSCSDRNLRQPRDTKKTVKAARKLKTENGREEWTGRV
ncbi:hypothetical protein CDL15_Pgr017042 [Punica granatum]|uniref:Uncharacterized protein n=1 Tax=Punica granatum TaxID=22663 RepID=A0A218WZY6_PUNGR|nr:hypothetical protein CDL15_Pgr017042 [Punica granatum]